MVCAAVAHPSCAKRLKFQTLVWSAANLTETEKDCHGGDVLNLLIVDDLINSNELVYLKTIIAHKNFIIRQLLEKFCFLKKTKSTDIDVNIPPQFSPPQLETGTLGTNLTNQKWQWLNPRRRYPNLLAFKRYV